MWMTIDPELFKLKLDVLFNNDNSYFKPKKKSINVDVTKTYSASVKKT